MYLSLFRLLFRGALAASFAAALPSPVFAEWTTLSLPDLSSTEFFVTYTMDQLPDGRLIYGTNNSLAEQNSFGSPALSSYANTPSWDPARVAIYDNTHGVVAGGYSAANSLYLFDPSHLNTAFQPVNLTIQAYTVVYRDASSFYVGGQNSTFQGAGGARHSISLVQTDGSGNVKTNRIIVDNISDYSGDFAMDVAGNLYVSEYILYSGSTHPGYKIYKFTASQLSTVVNSAGSPALTLADGQFFTTVDSTSSLAVDALGRLWSAGFENNGIDFYDPTTGFRGNFAPSGNNQNYFLSSFSTTNGDYISYLNASTGFPGSALTYGYDLVQNVPEPTSTLLMAAGLLLVTHLGSNRRADRRIIKLN